ncbi:phosphatase PAP2 family protein [Halobacillus litoralis]|uniref:Phosphatase PAP2 family protein n=1 Tax=Halobacillus litoralis TaxID=45668 RepID=A0A845E2H3_9BACI|nr:phosphatase PAP2 family protein [Halobacillus litoralis]MYL49957.1 phosphatase PAP2 family protein [Halobacillus litoralis]
MNRRLLWLLALNLFLFFLISWGVMTNRTFLTAMDEWGMNAKADPAEQTTIQIARFFSIATEYKICLTTGFIISFLFIYLNKYRISFFILLGAACTKLISMGLKNSFDRERPPGPSFVSVHGEAFPSAHMIYAVFLTGIIYILISIYFKGKRQEIFMLGGFLVVGMVGWSRVHLGTHYLSDVLGGFFIGVVWLLVLYLLSQKKYSNDVPRGDS